MGIKIPKQLFSSIAYLISTDGNIMLWNSFQFFGGVGKGGLLPLGLLDIQGGQFHQCVTNQQQGHYNLPTNTGVRNAKILLIKWVRWVICKTTDSHTQFHTGRRFTHLTNMITMDKKRWNCTQKKQDDCVQIQRGHSHSPEMITMGQDRKSKRERKSVEILPIMNKPKHPKKNTKREFTRNKVKGPTHVQKDKSTT